MNRRKLLQGVGGILSAYGASPLLALPAAAHPLAFDLLRAPDTVRTFVGDATAAAQVLQRSGDQWSGAGVDLRYTLHGDAGTIAVHAPAVEMRRIHLRWHGTLSEELLVLGDAWERSYGELAWDHVLPERVLPWYCLLHDGVTTLGFGVEVCPAALIFWQVDAGGVSLWLDLRNGGNGVRLAERTLQVATVVTYASKAGENAFQATQQLCRRMASTVVRPTQRGSHPLTAVYGSNDWYYAYGKNTADGLLRDADLIRELSPTGPIQPFTVVDDGYQDPKRFPDMHRLADQIRSRQVSPGIWIRPLRAPTGTKASWLLPPSHFGTRQDRDDEPVFDPTVPEALHAVLDVVLEARGWGYDLIKHDFTTYELLGQWGNNMGASPTLDGWNFQDRSRTNAEIITHLYREIRQAAGEDRIVIGCNTIGHLSTGIFDAQRTGDDVSGRDWERTRRMGVNTLAFRLPQNGIFFANDPDCVPITRAIPWKLTEQWLQAVAASGSVLLISPEPGAVGEEQKRAIRAAFSLCALMHKPAEPEDWKLNRTPQQWIGGEQRKTYEWISGEGASPFPL